MKIDDKDLETLKFAYTSEDIGPGRDDSPGYKVFEKYCDPGSIESDLTPIFEFWNTKHPTLRAWAFHGLYTSLKGKKSGDLENDGLLKRFQALILELLRDGRSLRTIFGCISTSDRKLNELHVGSVTNLHKSIIHEPVLEYCLAGDTKPTMVVGALLKLYLAPQLEPRFEMLVTRYANAVKPSNFRVKKYIVGAMRVYLDHSGKFTNPGDIGLIVKKYLEEISRDSTESQEIPGETPYQRDTRQSSIHDDKANLKKELSSLASMMGLKLPR